MSFQFSDILCVILHPLCAGRKAGMIGNCSDKLYSLILSRRMISEYWIESNKELRNNLESVSDQTIETPQLKYFTYTLIDNLPLSRTGTC